jgi:hypothetical protein
MVDFIFSVSIFILILTTLYFNFLYKKQKNINEKLLKIVLVHPDLKNDFQERVFFLEYKIDYKKGTMYIDEDDINSFSFVDK